LESFLVRQCSLKQTGVKENLMQIRTQAATAMHALYLYKCTSQKALTVERKKEKKNLKGAQVS
jgi:septation ring formation regulator EzrA